MDDIILYTNHCPLCNCLKELLEAKKIAYTQFTDIDAMVAMGLTRMPVLQIAPNNFLKYKEALKWLEERT